jgi:hypothetical protein
MSNVSWFIPDEKKIRVIWWEYIYGGYEKRWLFIDMSEEEFNSQIPANGDWVILPKKDASDKDYIICIISNPEIMSGLRGTEADEGKIVEFVHRVCGLRPWEVS